MQTYERYSKYRVMWILTAFDLPTLTKKNRKDASNFRKDLLADGFAMLQFSVYARHCSSREHMEVHINRIKKILPEHGKVNIFQFTDAQFGQTIQFYAKKEEKPPEGPRQLLLF